VTFNQSPPNESIDAHDTIEELVGGNLSDAPSQQSTVYFDTIVSQNTSTFYMQDINVGRILQGCVSIVMFMLTSFSTLHMGGGLFDRKPVVNSGENHPLVGIVEKAQKFVKFISSSSLFQSKGKKDLDAYFEQTLASLQTLSYHITIDENNSFVFSQNNEKCFSVSPRV
jgi:hypothetical protein